MDDDIRSVRLKMLQGRLGDLVYSLTHLQFSNLGSSAWKPAINAYRCRDHLEICVDLAGVDVSEFQVVIKPGRMLLRGERKLPEPPSAEGPCEQILTMEIDHGAFEREIAFRGEIDAGGVTAQQRMGMLWIKVPFRKND